MKPTCLCKVRLTSRRVISESGNAMPTHAASLLRVQRVDENFLPPAGVL